MDAKVLDSLTALLNQALTTQLVVTALVSVVAAGLGSYFGAYLTKMAERRAAKAVFGDVLKEQIETTFETERVKSAIASAATKSLEQLRTDLQQQMAFVTFRRERLAKMKDMMFEGAVALDTLRENCKSVPWLARTAIEDIHERGHAAIARVVYALAELREMQAAADEKSGGASTLNFEFEQFAGPVATYKQQITAGNIEHLGRANDVAREAETDLIKAEKKWRTELEKLRTLVISLSVAPEQSPE
jgi:hypothetical protein